MKKIIKIVVTGGVCSGKTTGMQAIEEHFRGRCGLIFVPESATILVETGHDTREPGSLLAFQEAVMSLQLQNEEKCQAEAQNLPDDIVLMIHDRGLADAFGYLTEKEASSLLCQHGLTKEDMFSRYDAVIHLVTAADGAEKYYTNANNAARIETPEEARILDKRIASAWQAHPHHFIIGNDGDFCWKMDRLNQTIEHILINV